MKKILFPSLIVLIFGAETFAQASVEQRTFAVKPANNEIGIELGGTGFLYSLYFQKKIVHLAPNITFNLRLGGSAMPLFLFGVKPDIGYNINLLPTVIFFKNDHALETGLGVGFFDYTQYNTEFRSQTGNTYKIDDYDRFILLSPQFSYRYYLAKGKVYLRGSVLIHAQVKRWTRGHEDTDFHWLPYAGLSAGVSL